MFRIVAHVNRTMVHHGSEWASSRSVPAFNIDPQYQGSLTPESAARVAVDILSLNNAHDGEYVIGVTDDANTQHDTFVGVVADGSLEWRNASAPSRP